MSGITDSAKFNNNTSYYLAKDPAGGGNPPQTINGSLTVTGNVGIGGNLSSIGDNTLNVTSNLVVGGAVSSTGNITSVAQVGGASLLASGSIGGNTLTIAGGSTLGANNTSVTSVGSAGLSSSGLITATSLATIGNDPFQQIVSGTAISVAGYDAVTNTNYSSPVSAFRAYQPIAVPALPAGGTFSSPDLDNLVRANGSQIIAFSICSPYVAPDGANQQGGASAIWITDSRSGNSGGFVAPQVVVARAQGWGYAINGNGTSGNPISVLFTTSTATNAGVLTITKIC